MTAAINLQAQPVPLIWAGSEDVNIFVLSTDDTGQKITTEDGEEIAIE